MATLSPEEKLEYILFCLAHTETLASNFDEVASLKNMSSGDEAREKFKKLVEESGLYKLEGNRVVLSNGVTGPVTPDEKIDAQEPKTPRKSARATGTGNNAESPTPKRRRIQPRNQNGNAGHGLEDEDEDEEDEIN